MFLSFTCERTATSFCIVVCLLNLGMSEVARERTIGWGNSGGAVMGF